MTPFAIPYHAGREVIHDFPGIGFRPAWYPADFVGPRLDCPVPVAAPDLAYLSKYDGPVDPYGHVDDLASVWADDMAGIPAWSNGADEPVPCDCLIREPYDPPSLPAPVPVPASGAMLLSVIAAWAVVRMLQR
ncbi:hypothetical protein H4P12_08280 [Paracoccus sp. 11-3]|uniref:Uncharacterized protein n=1 Tax=Paracoccus amoyensis TaxID=2760093 RepID=A0A926G912_9RHOB|nr:hypothetical protein [Paracoccus amoyensis]MBC9246708.1 hypothetical protein [Paracoccus amoyensis]